MAGQHQDGNVVGEGLGHAGEGVFDAGAGLDQADAGLVPVVDPAVGIGHIHRAALHPGDHRADAGGGHGVNQRVVGEAESQFHAFLLEDVGDGGFALHYSSCGLPAARRRAKFPGAEFELIVLRMRAERRGGGP